MHLLHTGSPNGSILGLLHNVTDFLFAALAPHYHQRHQEHRERRQTSELGWACLPRDTVERWPGERERNKAKVNY